ncbi:MAG: ABC transporter substrate-binding protein [Corynebacterium sp.]|nr:ABC transporter substrate-binding protein [Corynebacterium sp.]
MRKICSAVLLVLSMSSMLVACVSHGKSEEAVDYRYGNYVQVNSMEPQDALIPAAANEERGGAIVDLLYSGLLYLDARGEVHNEQAEDITKEDSRSYRVRLREGLIFSDGTPVRAQDYVDSWNYAAREELPLAHFMEPIAGYEIGAEAMSGLEVIDEHSFTIKLSEPHSDFLTRLAYSAFAVMPPQAIEDMSDFRRAPIGSGPYVLAEWHHNDSLLLVPNKYYEGGRKAQNEGIRFRHFATLQAAYYDLLHGDLDVLDSIPPGEYSSFSADLAGRSINQPSAIVQTLGIPVDARNFRGQAGQLRRQAISLALDRVALTEGVFQGTRTPAKEFTSPVVRGFTDNIAGTDVVNFDPVHAQELWAQAEAIEPFEGEFEIAYNADGANQDWVEVAASQLSDTLHIPAKGRAYEDFRTFRDALRSHDVDCAFRAGWMADYPAMSNFLEPQYASYGSANDTGFHDDHFDQLLTEAAETGEGQHQQELYKEAQEILLTQLPAIPLWYSNVQLGYSEAVYDVEVMWNGVPNYAAMKKVDKSAQ